MGEVMGIGRGIGGDHRADRYQPWCPFSLPPVQRAGWSHPAIVRVPLMASPVLYRRRPTASQVRRTEGHGRSRSRRARRRAPGSRSGYGALAGVILVVAACASLLTSIYLLSLISY